MNNPHLFYLVSGLLAYAVLYMWRKAAIRWNTWFPGLKKVLEWSLLGSGAAVVCYALYRALSSNDDPLLSAALFGLGLAGPQLYQLVKGRQGAADDETQRGAEVGSALQVRQAVLKSKQPADIEIGGIPVPKSSEPYHFLIAGSTGTGKSVAINSLLQKLRARGDTVILVDSGGDFTSKHFDPQKDFIFNPFDDRCVGWSPTLEMQGSWDAQALARSIVPDGIGDSREWNNYAQTFMSSVLRRLWETKRLNLQDFLYFVQQAPTKELKELLEGTPAMSQLASEKTFGSIRTIASNYLMSYDFLPVDRQPFSVTEMIQAEHAGMLFVTYREDQLDSLRNIIASLLDVASRAVLSLQPDQARRVWLIIDEFASIGRVQSVEAVATKARKAGGCLVLGIQSISQLNDRYGENGARTILSCLSSWLVLRCSDADTAEYMSRFVGEAEVLRAQNASSSGDTGDSNTVNEQRLTKRVVLASEIQGLANLNGIFKLAGNYPVASVKLDVTHQPKVVAEAFVPRKAELLKIRRSDANPPASAPDAERELQAPAKVVAAAGTGAPVPSVQPATSKPRVSREVPAESFEKLKATLPPVEAPKTNLLLEASKGVPTLRERLAQLQAQRAADQQARLERIRSQVVKPPAASNESVSPSKEAKEAVAAKAPQPAPAQNAAAPKAQAPTFEAKAQPASSSERPAVAYGQDDRRKPPRGKQARPQEQQVQAPVDRKGDSAGPRENKEGAQRRRRRGGFAASDIQDLLR